MPAKNLPLHRPRFRPRFGRGAAWRRALGAAALLALACHQPRLPPGHDLAAWGLPQDLRNHLGSLQVLTLTGPVDRLDWLDPQAAPALEELTLRATGMRRIAPLPPRLHSLDLAYSRVEEVSGWPPALRSLDVRGTGLTQLQLPSTLPGVQQRLPPLLILRAGHGAPRELPPLPAELAHLEIEGPEPTLSGDALPGSLQGLALRDVPLADLPPLPAELQSLELVGTEVEQLGALPLSLRRLVLLANLELKLEALPPTLERLEVGNAGRFDAALLPADLRSLRLTDLRLDGLERLPAGLEELALQGIAPGTVGRILELASGVHTLKLDGRDLPEGLTLPASVRELDLFLPPAGVEIPAGVARLALYSPIGGLPALPEELRSLELVMTPVSTADLAALPEGLEELALRQVRLQGGLPDLSHTTLQRLSLADSAIDRLPPLPPTLRALDVSNTGIRDLAPLAGLENLEELTLHVGQVQRLGPLAGTLRVLHFREAQ